MDNISIREAKLDDLVALAQLEQECFQSDHLSKRSFRRHIIAAHSDLLLAEKKCDAGGLQILGYGLSLRQKGTRLARLYSLAVHPDSRGSGIAKHLLNALEKTVVKNGRLYMRLEVAKNNQAAIRLYEHCGYRIFGEYSDYYEDHSDALRMQKTIRKVEPSYFDRFTPWYQQTTEFTCGPAALMMAMASLNESLRCEQELELDIWREATTIFMTSGHGGCHPLGLALAATRRSFDSCVWLNTDQPLFIDGVRADNKKKVMTVVHNHFVEQCLQNDIAIRYQDVTQYQVESWLSQGYAVLMLISTFRLDGKKAPHWVVITGMDAMCLYVHDPDLDEKRQLALDAQHIPIAREDFDRMSTFGSSRLRTAVAIKAR